MKNNLHQPRSKASTLGFAATALALLSVFAGNASAQCTSCVNAVTLPSGLVTFSTIDFNEDPWGDPAAAGNGYFTLNVTGLGPGSDMANGPYAAWCGAWYSSTVQNTGTPGYPVLSTYAPGVPAAMRPRVPGNTLNMVNYILNHKTGTVQDVQDAIWLIMVGSTDLASPASPTALALAADAQANGAGYVPAAFGIMAVFYTVGPNALAPDYQTASQHLQTLLLELPVPLANSTAPALTCSVNTGRTGTAYSSSLVAMGGVGPYTYSILGSLPNGLTLGANGLITGTPTASASYSFTARVVDAGGQSGSNTSTAPCTINVQPPSTPLSLVCPTGITGQVGVAYSSALSAAGGTGMYSYSLAGGSLGSLTLNASSGLISGIPSAAGSLSFIGRVTDTGDTALSPVSTTCNIAIVGAPTTTCPVISATQGLPISAATLVPSLGAGAPYTFAASGLPAGLVMSATGVITGTSTVSGTFAYAITITDANGNPGTITCSLTVTPAPPALTLACPSSTGRIGVAYSSSLVAGGGTGSYTFALTGGSLPVGLTLNTSTGLISGTPTSGTTFSFTTRVTDNSGNSAVLPVSSTCGITLTTSSPTTTCVSISATQGQAITPVTLVGQQGAGAPYTFSATGLPAGLHIAANGTISGTPTVAGTFNYTIYVTDKDGNCTAVVCCIVVRPCPPVITLTCPGSTGQVGLPYSSTFRASGGTGRYAYSLISGSLAPGLTLNTVTGLISGTPSGSGNYTFGIKADDTGTSSVENVSKTCSMTITPAPTTVCPVVSAVKGTNIASKQLTGSAGAGGPYTFSATGLPAGLVLSTSGLLSGTPSVTGTFSYIITVKDKNGKPGTVTCSLTVAPPVVTNTPGISLTKTANVSRVNPYQKVCYTYVVKNTGSVDLTNITVGDDNATPGFTSDDFTVGTVASLAVGASKTLSACIYPPVTQDAQDDDDDDDRGWGSSRRHDWDDDSDSKDGGTVICKELSNGDIQVTYRQEKSLTDNTYGRGSSRDWGSKGQSFNRFAASTDGVEFRILDKKGNVTLDFVADYLSRDSRTRSGWNNLGIKGGGGKVYKGNGAHVLKVDSSLNRNLNKQTKYNQSTKDSPEGAKDWEDEQNYTVVISKEACAKYGFGGVSVPKVRNECSKRRKYEGHVTKPSSSIATNTATASVTVAGQTIKATAKASVKIDASKSGWSQCDKY